MPEISTPEKLHRVHDWVGAGSISFVEGRPYSGTEIYAQLLATMMDVPLLRGAEGINSPELSHSPLVLVDFGDKDGEQHDAINALEAAGHPLRAVPYIEIPEGESFRRMIAAKGGPDNDTHISVREKLTDFEARTAPAIKTYELGGRLLRVNGMQESDMVFKAMVDALYNQIRA